MGKTNIFGYKPSGLEYTEIALLLFCLPMHFMPWVSLTVDGKNVLSFEPFSLFGTTFMLTVFAVFLVTVAMKFVGRFSGMTFLVVVHLGVLVSFSHITAKKANEMLEQIKGMTNMFGSKSGYTSHNMEYLYILIGVFVVGLAFCMLLSWFNSAYRLMAKHRRELRRGYYIGILGYLLVSIVAVWVAYTTSCMVNANNTEEGIDMFYPMIITILAAIVMLVMLTNNLIVVVLLELLRERSRSKMQWWSLLLSAVFAVAIFLLIKAEDDLFLPSPFDGLEHFFNQSSHDVGIWAGILIAKCMALTACITCLLRAAYFAFYHNKMSDKQSVVSVIDEKQDEKEESLPQDINIERNRDNETPDTETVAQYDEHAFVALDDDTGDRKRLYMIGGIGIAVILLGLGLWYGLSGGSSEESGMFAGKPVSELFPKIKKVVEVGAEQCTLHSGPGKSSSVAIHPYSAQENEGFVVYPGQRLAVLDETDGWYKVAYKDRAGSVTYIDKSLCRDVATGNISSEDVYSDWYKDDEECGGAVSVVRQPSGNRLVVKYDEVSCDANSLSMGVFQDGMYVFYYTIPVTSLEYKENETGLSITKQEDGMFYQGTYGKDVSRTVKYEWGEVQTVDWAKVPEDKLAEIFSQAIAEGWKQVEVLTANDIMEGKNQAEEEEDASNVTGYRIEEQDNEQVLVAEFGTASEYTDARMAGLVLHGVADFDGDGNMDAFVQDGFPGSSGVYCYSVVYYDKTSEKFKTTEDNITTMSDSPAIVDWEDRKCIVVSDGIKIERYGLEPPKLKVIKTEKGDVGSIVVQIPIDKVFDMIDHSVEYEEREISADVNGDGVDETILFSHGDARVYALGDFMGLERIRWADGSFTEECGDLYGDKFAFLQNKTNGLPDILVSGVYLYRWSGSTYEQWKWNGTEFLKNSE